VTETGIVICPPRGTGVNSETVCPTDDWNTEYEMPLGTPASTPIGILSQAVAIAASIVPRFPIMT